MAFKIKANIPAAKPSVDPKPAAKHFDIVLGLDFHVLKVPWPITPCPITPFSALVFDPMDYIHCTIPAMPVYSSEGGFTIAKDVPMGGTVLINDFYRGAAQGALWGLPSVPPLLGKAKGLGSIVKALNLLHFVIPQPLFLLPKFFHPHEGQMSHGSKTVLTQSMYQSTLLCRAYSCQDVGKILMNNPTGGFYLNFLTAIVAVLPMGKPVAVGGPKVEQALKLDDLINSLMFMGIAAIAKGALKLLGKLLTKLLDKIEGKYPGFGKYRAKIQPFICKYLGEPVDAASGHMASYLEGFSLPGPIPFTWDANYYSDSSYDGPLGKNVYHSYDITLLVNEADEMVIMNDTAGRPIIFPTLERGQKFFNPIEKYELHRSEEGEYFVGGKNGLYYYFNAPLPGSNGHGQLRTIVNRNGFAIRFAYNPKGHLTQITDSADRIIAVENNAAGQITALRLPHPELAESGVSYTPVRYAYDQEGRMIQLTDAEGHSNRFEWNKRLITTRSFNNGVTFTFAYDKQERCTAALGPNGLFSYTFEYMEGCTIATNAVGARKHYYHKDGIVTRIVNSRGAEQLFTYDEYSNLIAESNESGQLKTYTYDERGNTTQIGLPGQGTVAIDYNELDKPVEVTLPTGAVWQYEYDELGNLQKRINPEQAATIYEYRRDGLLHSITNAVGAATLLQYNHQYLISRVQLPTGASLRYQYDGIGRCTQIHTPTGGIQYRWYDLLGNVLRIDSPDGNRTDIRYDSMGNAIHAKDRHGEVALDYNFFGKVTRRMQGRQSIYFKYDREGQLTEVINEHDERYLFELDSEGDVVVETGFDGLARHYLRDKGGRVIQLTKPDGNHDAYEYNAAGQIITIYHEADGSSEQYAYNKAGLLTKALNADAEVLLERDIMGRIISENSNEDSINHTYDIAGNLLQTISNLGANINNAYDMMGNLIGCDAMGWTSEILRDNLGLEIENLLPGNIKNVWQRDKAGRPLLQMVEKRGKAFSNGVKYRKEFAWDADKLMSITDTVKGGKIHFEYDQWQNLSRTIFGDGEEQLRNPDAIGNLFESKDRRDRKYDKGGRLIKSKNAEYKYDKLGNVIEKKESANRIWRYVWNEAGMLTKVIRPEGTEVTFKYDALGRRIEKRFKHTITKYVWNGNVLLHEHKLFDARESTADDIITWVFSQEKYTPVAKIKGEKKYSLVADHLGTPTQGYNEDGDLIWNRELDSYGKTRMLRGEDGFCNFTYQGQDYDKDINLTYNRFRWYNQEEGVYCTQDPILIEGGLNVYSFVKDTNLYVDIFGLSDSSILGGNLGAAPGINHDAHHVVMANSKDSRMEALRNQMDGFKPPIGKNAKENGIWLPRTADDRLPGTSTTAHKGEGIHSDDYKQSIFERLDGKTRAEFIEELDKIKGELESGKTYKCKK